SGNLQQGIAIHITGCDSTLVTRNFIGTDISGTSPLPNEADGIRIAEGPRNSIIGGSPALGNIIAFNGGNGITIMADGDDYHLISANSIYSNTGIGIDLFPPGVTENDAGDTDTGPNQGMNFPVIDTVVYFDGSGETLLSGTMDTQSPESVTIEIFKAEPDPSGYGEGKVFLASVIPETGGNWNAIVTGCSPSDFFTTTATDADKNTSEFSLAKNTYGPVATERIALQTPQIRVWPNPARNELFIAFPAAVQGIAVITIFTMAGQKVLDVSRYIQNGNKISLYVNQLPEGQYTVLAGINGMKYNRVVCILRN
ncbi:MAG: T9SS type A sorting domain-containing protein, partial [Bacteroidetes bacterium]|nr:T9SS type A sorting domain-containing protein [Bacteroidota bacterium]